MQVLQEFRVVRRAELPAALQAVAPGEQAERPLRRNVDVIGTESANPAVDPAGSREGEADLGIERGAHLRKRGRLQNFDGVAEFAERLRGGVQRPHDAVHLRVPRVGHDQDAGHACGSRLALMVLPRREFSTRAPAQSARHPRFPGNPFLRQSDFSPSALRMI